ncbi:alpha/beta fold hydrolase [Gallaecimonas sp. GXIMD4217]|uniref:alpha/beta hydrolase n=1 Tax=Gallaecimonas sp. GXIMD4217 TaxID=3131927 RepID=UPI00311B1E71
MPRILPLALLSLGLTGCSAHISESAFIAQDKAVSPYQDAELNQWQARFPGKSLKRLQLTSQDQAAVLHGLLLDDPDSKELIFFIPGNGMKVAKGGIEVMETLADLGRDVAIFDRRGLGASTGKATVANQISDAVQQYHYLRRELEPSFVTVHGFSLGSFVAGQLAKRQDVDALVLQGSATNVDDWIDESTPWFMKPFLTVEVDEAFRGVDNQQVVARDYDGPLLVIGGEQDEQVPVVLSQRLFEASRSSQKQLLIVQGAGHGNMLEGKEELSRYRAFLDKLGGGVER